MRIGAVVLAAGIASRMGDFKPMLPLGKESVIQNVVRVLQSAGARQIVVVTGYRSEVLVDHLKNTGVMFAENKRFAQTKMFDSVLLGLRALGDTCDKVLVTPADVPLVRVDTVRALLGEEGPCVRPLYQGEPGHPILLDRAVLPLLMGCSGKGGLRGAIQELGLPLRDVAVEDENTIFDIDTPDDYVTVLHRAGQRRIRMKNQLVIGTDELFFGSGCAQLLEMIDLTGTITAASEAMHMSYSKAWKMLNKMEEQLGDKVVIRSNGGSEGGSTSLTDRGRQLLRAYRGMQQELSQAGEALLRKYFGDTF